MLVALKKLLSDSAGIKNPNLAHSIIFVFLDARFTIRYKNPPE